MSFLKNIFVNVDTCAIALLLEVLYKLMGKGNISDLALHCYVYTGLCTALPVTCEPPAIALCVVSVYFRNSFFVHDRKSFIYYTWSVH